MSDLTDFVESYDELASSGSNAAAVRCVKILLSMATGGTALWMVSTLYEKVLMLLP